MVFGNEHDQFGEEYRPCKLSRFVVPIQRKRDQNDFVFARSLDFKIYGVLEQHSVGKPILVFCSTRKGEFTNNNLVLGGAYWDNLITKCGRCGVVGVMVTAEQLLKEYDEATAQKKKTPWARPGRLKDLYSLRLFTDEIFRIQQNFHDKRLESK